MGYHCHNEVRIRRDYTRRKIIVSVYTDELEQWFDTEYDFGQDAEACAHATRAFNGICM